MKTSPALRWACYAIAAAGTAAAMWHVDHRGDAVDDTIQPVRPARRGLAMPVAAARPVAPADALAILKQRLDAAMNGSADPFSDNRPAPAPAPVPVQAQAAAPAALVAPAMPFVYVGRWQEQGETQVFLRAGDRVLTVRGPGPLEGGFVVETVATDSLTIRGAEGTRHTLSFAAPAQGQDPASAPAQAVQTTTASTPDAAPEEN